MNFKSICQALLILALTPFQITAQKDLKIGEWQSYLPYQVGNYVTQSNTHVYWATQLSILKMSKTDMSIERLDKSNQLSDVGINLIRYNRDNDNLLIAYKNHSIDLIKSDGTIILLNDIKNNVNIIGEKNVNDVFFSRDTAYLACSFGVVKLDMKRNEFISTTFTKLKTTGISVVNDQIFAATEGGLYSILNDRKNNISDFKQWKKWGITDGFPTQYRSSKLCIFNSKLYFDLNDTLSVLQNNRPLSIRHEPDNSIKFMTAEGQNLLVGLVCGIFCDSKAFILDKTGKITFASNNCIDRVNYGIEDAKGGFWYGDDYAGFRFSASINAGCNTPTFNSISFPSASDIVTTDSSVIVAAGGSNGASGLFNAEGFAQYKNGSWRTYSRSSNGVFAANAIEFDFYRIAIHPNQKKYYVGTLSGGMVEVENEAVTKIYNEKNSALRSDLQSPNEKRVGGMAFDNKGNLWLSNTGAAEPIVVFKADGKWESMGNVPVGANRPFQVVIDSSNNKWFTVGGTGILIFNEGKTIEDRGDDKVRLLETGTLPKELQSAIINCLAVDIDGRVWVGTNNGVAYYECGNDPFNARCVGRLVVSGLDGIGEYLLREKAVNTIAIDGANRKWFGTTSGIFVQSPDGKDEILKFNTENSPLLSNNVTAITIRQSTGEVFIGTDKGLMSYRSDAIRGNEFNKESEAYAYPNPVRPDYTGPIAIKGLARDSNVKITDVNGNIVFETKALGGQAIWQGNDFNGRRVASGVYLVFSTNTINSEADDAIVTKILFIN
jgi:ligand-binding sensor domain-containing protein